MQNEGKGRKRKNVSLIVTSPHEVLQRKDEKIFNPSGKEENNEKVMEKNPPSFPQKKSRIDKEEKKKDSNFLVNISYVYLLIKYFFDNNNVTILNESFYLQENVLTITESLIGHILWVYDKKKKILYGSRITELEAYNGIKDKASHAYNNKKTNRNKTMFQKGGISYVYLCYGIHNCLNIVTNYENIPDAILVRALEPIYNIEHFLFNRYETSPHSSLLKKSVSLRKGACITRADRAQEEEKADTSTIEGANTIGADTIRDDTVQGAHVRTRRRGKNMQHRNNFMNEEKKQNAIDKLKEKFKTINKKKLEKVCSGPGCVTKCLGITREDDKANFYVNPHFHSNTETGPSLTKGELHLDESNIREFNFPHEEDTGTETGSNYPSDDGEIKKKKKIKNNRNNVMKKSGEMEYSGIENEKINPYHYFSCNINDLQKNRFFISLCPTINEVINFYETLISKKKEKENIIRCIYSEYKLHLLNYFDHMKWNRDTIIIQRDKRIGVAYAEEAAMYDYRFLLKNHPSISVHPK
ncbi:DNA-3-methyladenine glycosylase [Plasmodium gonderi]|uniref:DNA-3-methyladenine glycosylase II n=1 Tax=Plasmodium gonderi TaxID=77519 RepID=A0A1Y1JQT3_PLAGO|nr:DNA-3-methyladenine glycosylase [Plasmodium gonderi]GAW82414.1 DNA-3-methyladenine glycosylase [Plasmodium gonderi]